LNRNSSDEKRKLYQQIIQLPYQENCINFEKFYETIIEDEYLSENHVNYLEKKYAIKNSWAKAYMKDYFCCGSCTTSRIEAKHRVLKQYLNSSKRISEVFQVFQQL